MKLFFNTLLGIASFLILGFTARASDSSQDPNSSGGLRKGKNFIIVGQPVGLGPLGSVPVGASVGLYLGNDSILGAHYFSARNFLISTNFKLRSETMGIDYKKFLSNSFYFRIGADYRRMTYEYLSYIGVDLEEYTQFRGSSSIGTFAIGNHWQWDSFTLGCDWFGMNIPVAYTIDSESTAGTFSSNVRRLSDDKQKYLRDTSMFFTQLYLGISF